MRNQQEVREVTEIPVPLQPCFTCQSTGHKGEHCPISPPVRDLMAEHANVVGQNRPLVDAQYGNTYNLNWKDHPNLSWKPKPPAYVPPGAQQQQQYGSTSHQQQPPTSSPVEQAIIRDKKIAEIGRFFGEISDFGGAGKDFVVEKSDGKKSGKNRDKSVIFGRFFGKGPIFADFSGRAVHAWRRRVRD